MPQGNDIGAVDAHEAVGRQLFDEVFQAVEDDDRRLRIDQEDLDIFAHALHIEDLADIDAEGPVVRLEVEDRVRLPGFERRLHLQMPPKFFAGCFKFLETEWLQQVVHGIDPEPFHGIFRIGRREDNGGRMRQ